VLARATLDPALGYAEEVFGLLDSVLADAGINRSAVDTIAVVRGPGSFTGLRIGVMTAKTLAHAAGWQLRAARTLDLVAAGCGRQGREVLALAAAGRGHLWCARYEFDRDVPLAPAIERVDVGRVAAHVGTEALVAATDTEVLASVAGSIPEGRRVLVPALAEVLALHAEAGTWPAETVNPLALVPEYAGVSQAERAHGVDLHDEGHRPVRPRAWE
jgi:tRNA threonylcarbamoyladenosine biosynthesis protein TsaB